MRRPTALAIALALGACTGAQASGPDAASDASDASVDAARPPAGPARGSFEFTYYWIAAEADYPGAATTPLYAPSCQPIATVTAEFARAIALEGTGRLRDGRLLNVDGACSCGGASTCYVEAPADHAWGTGVQDRALAPYRSIAVDRTVVPYGTRLWLAELDGVTMPGDPPWGGFVHDGCVIAADTGGGIVGMHIDWFVGLRASYRTLDPALGLSTITAHDGGARCP